MSFGKAFHNVGAAILKALSPYVLELDKGTRSRLDEEDLSDLVGLYLSMMSEMYLGASPCRALKVINKILKSIRCSIGSQ